jgi:hypothetical protein
MLHCLATGTPRIASRLVRVRKRRAQGRRFAKPMRSTPMKPETLEKLKHAEIGEPIDQPVIFAILVILIAITLYFIFT